MNFGAKLFRFDILACPLDRTQFRTTSYPESYAAYEAGATYYIPNTLANITVEDGLNTINAYAFGNLSKVSSITINCEVISVNNNAFCNDEMLSSITYADAQFTKVGAYAFYNCPRINTISMAFPKYVTENNLEFGNYSFARTGISSVDGNEIDFSKILTIGDYAFSGCTNIVDVSLTSNVKNIGKGIFADCQYLRNATLSFEQAREYMFSGCRSLVGVDLSQVTNVIPAYMFKDCTSLQYGVAGGIVFSSNTTTIGAHAFENCTSLTAFAIPGSCTTIKEGALLGCNNLEPLLIPNKVTTIEKNFLTEAIGGDFVIYVVIKESEWPSTWVQNWNCTNPVVGVWETTSIYTFEFNTTLKGYVITGITDGIELSGQINLPNSYNACPVVGINADVFRFQPNVNKIVIPNTFKMVGEGAFRNGTRVDVFFESTVAQLDALGIYKNQSEIDNAHSIISTGLIFCGDYWQYGNGTIDKNIPYIKLSSLIYELEDAQYDYDGITHFEPKLQRVKFPALYVQNNALGDGSIYTILCDKDIDEIKDLLNLFDVTYSNNIEAGNKAQAKFALNTPAYMQYVGSSSIYDHPQYLTGTGSVNFTINKKVLYLFMTGFGEQRQLTDIYNGERWTCSIWGNENVSGFPSDNANGYYRLTGTLSTTSANARTEENPYSIFAEERNSDFYWSEAWRVYLKNVDVTKNFEVEVFLELIINPMGVYVFWTGGEYAPDGTTYLYPYTGEIIKPEAKAYTRESNGLEVEDCRIVAKNMVGSEGIYPCDPDNWGAHSHTACAYISNTKNYYIINANGIGEHQGHIVCNYRIVKAKVNISLMQDYTIGYDELYWSLDDTTNFAGATITGLPEGSILEGQIWTVAKGNGTTAHDNTTYSTQNGTIQWNPKQFDIQYNNEMYPTLDYLVYRLVPRDDGSGLFDKVPENDYVEVSINMNIKIVYNTFDVHYYIDDEEVFPVDTIMGDNQTYGVIRYQAEGLDHEFTVQIGNQCTGTSRVYLYGNGSIETETPFSFYDLGQYSVGVKLTRMNFNPFYKSLLIDVVKSDLLFNNLDREYDGTPIKLLETDPLNPTNITFNYLKKYPAEGIIDTNYYSKNTDGTYTSIDAPIFPGTYYVHVVMDGTYYFNAYNAYNEFRILKRKVIFDLDQLSLDNEEDNYKDYDGTQMKYMLGDYNDYLHDKNYLLDGDHIQGGLNTRSTVPDVYDTSKPADFYWSPSVTVFNESGANRTSCYEVVLKGTFTIRHLEMEVESTVKPSPVGTYGYTYYVDVKVIQPATGYTIYYSLDPVNELTDDEKFGKWSGANANYFFGTEAGTFDVWFKVVAPNYKTYYGHETIIINNNTFSEPTINGLKYDNVKDKYYIDYDTKPHMVTVSTGMYEFANITYSTDGSNWTATPFEFTDLGDYTLFYRLENEGFETYQDSISFSVTVAHLESLDGHIKVIQDDDDDKVGNYEAEYDTNYHHISVVVTKEEVENYDVYYSLDGINYDYVNNPYIFKDAMDSAQIIYYIVVADGYQPYIGQASVYIRKITITDADVLGAISNYDAMFDGKYHNVIVDFDILDPFFESLDPDYKVYYCIDQTFMSMDLNTIYWKEYLRPIPEEDLEEDEEPVDINGLKKDVISWPVPIKIVAKNYEEYNTNKMIYIKRFTQTPYILTLDPLEIEYLGRPLTEKDLKTGSVHDDKNPYMQFYYAGVSESNLAKGEKCDNPTEVNKWYWVEIEYHPTSNCDKCYIQRYIHIVPRRLEVRSIYDEEDETQYSKDFIKQKYGIYYIPKLEYTGAALTPEPTFEYVFSGTSDKLTVYFNAQFDGDAIGIGTYTYKVSLAKTTENYVIVNPYITFEITKINFHVVYTDEKDYDGTPWTKSGIIGWDSISCVDKLLTGHIIDASMYTSGVNAYNWGYTYNTDNAVQNDQTVYVEYFKIYDKNHNDVTELYNITYDLTIYIRNPKLKINLDSLSATYYYDGQDHIINVGIDTNIGNVQALKQYSDKIDGEWHDNPIGFREVGEHTVYYKIIVPGYEMATGEAKLTILKTPLEIDIIGFNNVIYNGYSNFVTHSVTNVVNVDPELAKVKYYLYEDYTEQQIIDFYMNFNEKALMYVNALDAVTDAGKYYAVVYYPDCDRWYASFEYEIIEILPIEIPVTLVQPMSIVQDYNKNKYIVVGASDATYDWSNLLMTHQVKSTLGWKIKSIKNDAGTYDGLTDFMFDTSCVWIWNLQDMSKNVAKNYKPVVSNLSATINKIDLGDDKIKITSPFMKEYDGTPANENDEGFIKSESNGQINITYYDVTTNSLLTPEQAANIGVYNVIITQGEGTNYFAKYTYDSGAQMTAVVIINPRTTEIVWEDLEVSFNGTMQKPKAYYIDVEGHKQYLTVEIEWYGVYFDGMERAGEYVAWVTEDVENYAFTDATRSASFVINPAVFTLDIGNQVGYVNNAQWRMEFTESDFVEQPFLEGLILTNNTESGNPFIITKNYTAQTYEGNYGFDINYMIKDALGTDYTSSITIKLVGKVVLEADEIMYTLKGEEGVYEITYNGAPHSLTEILTVSNPAKVDYLYSVDDGLTWSNGIQSFTNVGDYTIRFKISASEYEEKEGTVILRIVPKQSYINFGTLNLSKDYDALAVTETSIVISGEYNGISKNDLDIQFWEKDGAQLDTANGEYPINAGDYVVKIFCKNDDDPDYIKNYTTLVNAEYEFTIRSKVVRLIIDEEYEVNELNPTAPWKKETGLAGLQTSSELDNIVIYNLSAYDNLIFNLQSTFNISRGLHTLHEKIGYNDGLASVYYDTTAIGTEYAFSWYIVHRELPDQNDDVSKNYLIDLTLNLLVRLPRMQVEIQDVSVTCDGNYHYGTLNIISPTTPQGLEEHYGLSEDNLTSSNISDIKFSLPGVYRIYYKIVCDLHEPAIGSYTITIEKLERTVTIDLSNIDNEEYKGVAFGTPNVNGYYILPMTVETKPGYVDGYDSNDIVTEYKKTTSPQIFKSAIDAGNYTYTVIIPATTYFKETRVTVDFVIAAKVIRIIGTYHSYYTGGVIKVSDMQNAKDTTDHPYTFKFKKGDALIPDTLTIQGTLCTYPGLKGHTVGIYYGDGTHGGDDDADGRVMFENASYIIYDNGVRSNNYQLVPDADTKIVIDPAPMVVVLNKTVYEYNALPHYPTLTVVSPAYGTQVLYSANGTSYSTTPVSYIEVGKYPIHIKVVSTSTDESNKSNYADYTEIVELVIKARTLTLDWPSQSKVYDYQEVLEPTVFKSNNPNYDRTTSELCYYKYNEDLKVWQGPIWTSNFEDGGSRPRDVGRYKLEVTVPLDPNGNYTEGVFEKEFTITPAQVKVKWDKVSFIYNAKSQHPVAKINEIEEFIHEPVTYVYTIERISDGAVVGEKGSVNVGGYRITITLDDNPNYEIDPSSATAVYSIERKAMTITYTANIDFDNLSNYELFVRGVTVESDVATPYHPAGSVIGNEVGDGLTVTGLEETDYIRYALILQQKTVDNYELNGAYKKDGDFKWNATSENAIVLCKVDTTGTNREGENVTNNYTITYNVKLTVVYSNIEYSIVNWDEEYDGEYHSVEVIVSNVSTDLSVTYSTSGVDGSYSNVAPKYKDYTDGNKVVYIKISKEGSQDIYTTGYVNIKKKNLEIKPEDPYFVLDKYYDGIPIANPEMTYIGKETSSETPIYKYYRIINDDGVDEYIAMTSNPTSCGKYKLEVSVSGADNYGDSKYETEFEIKQRKVTVRMPNVTNSDSMAYTGKPWTKLVVSGMYNVYTAVANTLDDGLGLIAGQTFGAEDKIMTTSVNAGTYKTPSTFDGYTGNKVINSFRWVSGYNIYSGALDVTENYIVEILTEVTISKAKIDLDVDDYIGTWDGKEHFVIITANDPTIENLIIEYADEDDDTKYSTTPIGSSVAGTKTVYVRVKDIYDNYDLLYKTGQIKLEPLTDKSDIVCKETKEYDGYAYNKDGTDLYVINTSSTATLEITYYTKSSLSEDSQLANAPINVGTYYAKAYLPSDGIYQERTYDTKTIVITAKDVVVEWEDLEQTYDGTAKSPKAYYTDIANNKVYVTVEDDFGEDKIDAGTYNVTAVGGDNDSNYHLTNAEEEFVIKKATIKEPEIYVGKHFVYGEEVYIYDLDGNRYIIDGDGYAIGLDMDEDGEFNEDLGDTPISPTYSFTFEIDIDKDADGVKKEEHYYKFTLDDADNYMWETTESSDPYKVQYYIDKVSEPDYVFDIVLNPYKVEYTGEEVYPDITIRVKKAGADDEEYVTLSTEDTTEILAGYKVTYKDNIDITPDGEYATAEIEGINNYDFTATKQFIIVPEKPTVLDFEDSSPLRFIGIEINEFGAFTKYTDGKSDIKRTEAQMANTFIGGLRPGITVYDLVGNLSNDNKQIRVVAPDGLGIGKSITLEDGSVVDNVVFNQNKEGFDDFTNVWVGTGWEVQLIDNNGNVVDKSITVLKGDLNGDGSIGAVDVGQYMIILKDLNGFTYEDQGAFYVATCVVGEVDEDNPVSISPAMRGNLMMYVKYYKDSSTDPDILAYDFNANYIM